MNKISHIALFVIIITNMNTYIISMENYKQNGKKLDSKSLEYWDAYESWNSIADSIHPHETVDKPLTHYRQITEAQYVTIKLQDKIPVTHYLQKLPNGKITRVFILLQKYEDSHCKLKSSALTFNNNQSK